jgi:predicted PurR-regulated permease PerM
MSTSPQPAATTEGRVPPVVSARAILRIVLIVVGVAVSLWVLYLLRQPLSWLFIAAFLAIALSGPVNLLQRRLPRGLAIAVVYLILLTVPFVLAAIFGPPLITQANVLAQNLPAYAQDVSAFVAANPTLSALEQNFDLTSTIETAAQQLPTQLADAATVLSGVGLALVNSFTAIVIVLVLCAFMLGSGKRWIEAALAAQRPEQVDRYRRVLDRVGRAIGNYVGGALLVGLIAGTLAFIVLTILGVPFAGPLAVLVGVLSLIPLIGQPVAAVIVGIVTLFHDFPTATIVWAIWAVIYAQVENHLLQPQIQRRAVDVHPFTVVVSVLFGVTLFGVGGAIVAIPAAASIQIAAREFFIYRQGRLEIDELGVDESEPSDDGREDAAEADAAGAEDEASADPAGGEAAGTEERPG